MRRRRRRLLLGLGLLLSLPPTARAAKTDVVTLDNGDVITGEIKKLDKGKLRLATDRTDDVYIEWEFVASLTSVNYFEFQIRDDQRFFGRLAEIDSAGVLALITDEGTHLLPVDEVVLIDRIQPSFWKRQDGSINLGLTYQSSISLLQYTLTWNNKFRTRDWYWTIDFSSVETFQEGQDPASRRDFSSSLTRFLGATNSLTGTFTAQSNREQGIELRTLGSLTGGHRIIHSNLHLLTVGAGLSAILEVPVEGSATESLEGLVNAVWSLFDYGDPSRSVDLSLDVYPGLTEWGRLRIDFSTTSRIEVIDDFFVGLTLLDTYDTDPPAGGNKNDLSLTFSLGYSY